VAELRTRKPTGKIPFPTIMVEGGENGGKSYTAYALSASKLVGRTFVLSLGERTVDGYARLGPYEILEHNGTYRDIAEQIHAATDVDSDPGKPNVIVIDSGSQLWHLHALMADQSARSTKAAREKLEKDPDAEIDTGMPHWNKTKDKWWDLFNHLRGWPGIVVVTVRAGMVTEVIGGQPTKNQVWSTQIEKGTPFIMTAVVRCEWPKPPMLRSVESLDVVIPAGGLELPTENTLEHLIFRLMGAGGEFDNGHLVNPALGVDVHGLKLSLFGVASESIQARDKAATPEQVKAAAAAICGEAWEEAELPAGATEVSTEEEKTVRMLLDVLLKDAARVSTEGPASVAPDGGSDVAAEAPVEGQGASDGDPGPAPAPKARKARTAPPAAAPV